MEEVGLPLVGGVSGPTVAETAPLQPKPGARWGSDLPLLLDSADSQIRDTPTPREPGFGAPPKQAYFFWQAKRRTHQANSDQIAEFRELTVEHGAMFARLEGVESANVSIDAMIDGLRRQISDMAAWMPFIIPPVNGHGIGRTQYV